MCNLKSVTVREVRQQFLRKVEAPLRRGETLILRKRKEVLGRIVPDLGRRKAFRDFADRQGKIFGKRTLHLNIGEFLRKERSRSWNSSPDT
jgi:antitoxin (DNA-binding transcriptional repressor) of toxin-antitoxin stability system